MPTLVIAATNGGVFGEPVTVVWISAPLRVITKWSARAGPASAGLVGCGKKLNVRDRETIAKVASDLAAQPGYENKALTAEAATEGYFGHLRRAEELYALAKDNALGAGDRATAADIEAKAAFLEAVFGNAGRARRHASAAISFSGQRPAALAPWGDPVQLMLALALAGDSALAQNVVDHLTSDSPPSGFASKVWLPEIRAAIELKRDNPTRAVELLAPVTRYEEGGYDSFLSAYLRGEAYRAEHCGKEALTEFQKIIEHRGVVLNSLTGALAHLGVARSYALEGDVINARTAYQDFLTLWKDADPGIPVLIAAKSELARLN